MSDLLVASINCQQCENAKFLVVQIENDLHLICVKCGYIANVQDTLVNQLANWTKTRFL